MSGSKLQKAIGLESLAVPIAFEGLGYIQGGWVYHTGDSNPGFGRHWFKDLEGIDPYSYVRGAFPSDAVYRMQGSWNPSANLEKVAVWFFSDATSRACAHAVYLFALPGV